MKQRIFAFALACLLLIAALPALANEGDAAPYAFTFRNGITWASTVEEVQQLEQQVDDEEADSSKNGAFTGLVFTNKRVSDYAGTLIFLFKDDVLQLISYDLSDFGEPDFLHLLAALKTVYGPSTMVEAGAAFRLIDAAAPGARQLEDFSDAQGWALTDGTQILTGYYSSGSIYVLYLNKLLLDEIQSINTYGL